MNHCEWIVKLQPEGNRPPAFRIVLADSQGRLQTPEPPGIGARAVYRNKLSRPQPRGLPEEHSRENL